MVLGIPDGSDARDEAVRVVWKSGDGHRVGLRLQELGESFSIVNVKRSAFDATRVGAKLRRHKTARNCVCGDRLGRKFYKIPDRIERQIADQLRRTNHGQVA